MLTSRTFYLALLDDDGCQTHTLQLEILHDQYRVFYLENKSDFDFSVTLRSLSYLFSSPGREDSPGQEDRYVVLIVWKFHMTAHWP